MKRVHLIISGDVQGVSFRSWARLQAQEFGLAGWVKNRTDGAVEILAEGSRGALENFVAACQHGPDVAWVEHVDVSWEEGTGEFTDFQVIY